MTLLPARADLALGVSCSRCTVRERCYRSPHTRAQAVGETQNWMETTPRPEGPCEEWWSVGEAIYLTADQVEAHRAAGWTVEPFTHHHGGAGYWLATRDA